MAVGLPDFDHFEACFCTAVSSASRTPSFSFLSFFFCSLQSQSERVCRMQNDNNGHIPEPHPYLHEPILYISALPAHVTDENLAYCFATCAPFRPKIPRDDVSKPLSGTIEFKFLEKGAWRIIVCIYRNCLLAPTLARSHRPWRRMRLRVRRNAFRLCYATV